MTKKGFTLMELMVVILLIAILAAVAIPFYNDAIDSQNNARAKAILETLNGGVERFQREYNVAIPLSAGGDRTNNGFTNIDDDTSCSYHGEVIGSEFTLQDFIAQLIACGYVSRSVNYENLDYVFRLQNPANPVCARGYVYMEPRAGENNKVSVGSKYCLESTSQGGEGGTEGEETTAVCTYCAGIHPYSGKAVDTTINTEW